MTGLVLCALEFIYLELSALKVIVISFHFISFLNLIFNVFWCVDRSADFAHPEGTHPWLKIVVKSSGVWGGYVGETPLTASLDPPLYMYILGQPQCSSVIPCLTNKI